MSLAPYIHAMGRGPSRGRSLTRAEAADAMRLILSTEAAPEAIGALLMLMRYRGETAEEVAGFVDAIRPTLDAWKYTQAGVDWPSYAAGRSRGVPWFLLSAKLVARVGISVFLHGWNSHQGHAADVRGALSDVGIPIAHDPSAAASALEEQRIVYVPLETMSPRLLELLRLRDVLGLRSAINTTMRVLNPSGAAASVQGVFHPPYRTLQQDVGRLVGQSDLTVLKGGGGEFERHPGKSIELFGLRGGTLTDAMASPLMDASRRLADEAPQTEHLSGLWTGDHRDDFAEAVVIGTAAVALWTAGAAADLRRAEDLARDLWAERHCAAAA